jgi:hypothetical protein
VLYARSRQVPASLAALVATALAVGALSPAGDGSTGDPKLPVLVLATGAMAASVGLAGQDPALDRTAALRWPPRRAAHVLLGALMVAGVFLTVQAATGGGAAGAAFVLRDSAGLAGLAALGAALTGGAYAWAPPFICVSYTLCAPPAPTGPMRAAYWLLLPAGTPAATWTALLLAAAGTAVYGWLGPGRWPGR